MVNGKCTLSTATNYFAVFPHMHQIGKHIQVTTTVAGTTNTVYNDDYSFVNQVFQQLTPIAMAKGDQIGVTCTYDNETGSPVQFGQSSYNEMCFAISFVSPPMPTGRLGDFCMK